MCGVDYSERFLSRVGHRTTSRPSNVNNTMSMRRFIIKTPLRGSLAFKMFIRHILSFFTCNAPSSQSGFVVGFSIVLSQDLSYKKKRGRVSRAFRVPRVR